MRIRAHNLLCIQGFVGKGYSREFVANMSQVVLSLADSVLVTVVDRPDVLCDACPNLGSNGCTLHGDGTESNIVSQDLTVMGHLGIEPGEALEWGEIRKRIRAAVEPDDLDSICGGCPWLPLGHCRDGLRQLHDET